MKRILIFFIFILLAMGPGAAGAQTVVMDEGHVAFDYPDSWLVVSPQLCGVYAPLRGLTRTSWRKSLSRRARSAAHTTRITRSICLC